MKKRNIVVIGASSGGFDALKELVTHLPSELNASIFIVWHIPSDIRSVLPQVLNEAGSLFAADAKDGEPIITGRIYIAPPDRHLLIEEDRIRVTRGPKENRFRPAIDPLFRSAAHAFRDRVIGVILSGALDDGTAGLWTIKHHGGITIVQNPAEAEVPSMPENAIREVEVDHVVNIRDLADLIIGLSNEEIWLSKSSLPDGARTRTEIRIAAEDSAFEMGIMNFGESTPFTCPECSGMMTRLMDGNRPRYRCHTGHAFSPDSLLAALTENIENEMYSVMRGIEESVMLLNHVGDHYAAINDPKFAGVYFNKAKEAEQRVRIIRRVVLDHERLSLDSLRDELEDKNR